jgi:hypothetical protein
VRPRGEDEWPPAPWFGVAEAQLPTVAPSIGNFAEQDLGFLI